MQYNISSGARMDRAEQDRAWESRVERRRDDTAMECHTDQKLPVQPYDIVLYQAK